MKKSGVIAKIGILFLLISCSFSKELTNTNGNMFDENISKEQEKTKMSLVINKPKNSFEQYQDTLSMLEGVSFITDSFQDIRYFDTEESCNLMFHETGEIVTKKADYSISMHSINDDHILVRLLKKSKLNWKICDSLILTDIRFSPSSFSRSYCDFNKDGLKDIIVNFYRSMSVAYSYGYIILVSPDKEEKLRLIKNSIKIPNLECKQGKIISITYNHPGHEPKDYTKVETFEIEGDVLKRIHSKKTYDN